MLDAILLSLQMSMNNVNPAESVTAVSRAVNSNIIQTTESTNAMTANTNVSLSQSNANISNANAMLDNANVMVSETNSRIV